jgi:phosphoribosyl 1,2-cyclic phosphate phosphodiesterase
LLVEKISSSGVTRVLIDTSPDLREQLLDHQISHLDGVLITHEHADHTHGIDDLRPLVIAMRQRIPFYVDEVTSAILRKRFGYCFETPPESDYPPILDDD